MPAAVEHDVLVDLVRDQYDARIGQDAFQFVQVAVVQHGAGGVVREIDHQGPGARRDGAPDRVPVGPVAGRLGRRREQLHRHRRRARQAYGRHVGVVVGLQHDDLVARAGHRQDGGHQGLGGAAGDGDFRLGIVGRAVQRARLGRDGGAQRRDSRHGGVLVVARGHGGGDLRQQAGIGIEIGEALAQIDGAGFRRQPAHDGKDGDADVRQFGINHQLAQALDVPFVFIESVYLHASTGGHARLLPSPCSSVYC